MKLFFFQRLGQVMWLSCFLLLASSGSNGLQQPGTGRAASPQSPTEKKVATWKGLRVRLLDEGSAAPQGQRFYLWRRQDGSGEYVFHFEGRPKEGIPPSFVGKAGTIVDCKVITEDVRVELLIELDDPKVRIVGDPDYLAFFNEKEEGEKLIGKVLWARGQQGVNLVGGKRVLTLSNLQPVTVIGAEWGEPVQSGPPVKLRVKTDSGEEGYLQCQVDPGFHIFLADQHLLSAKFHADDPRKRFPSWSAATWDLIRKQIVAIGMTEEQARFACGDELREVGAKLSPSGEASPIYKCDAFDSRFLVRGGKVVEYVAPK